jgi:hAT family C-terminal dimerisation region
MGRRAQFPNLFWLACDILSIPGSTVAVARVFSGGRDTISLRRASFRPETIRILMLVKKKLHLDRVQLSRRGL